MQTIEQYGQIGVLGYGVTGQSVVRFLERRGITPQVFDTRSAESLALPALPDLQFHWGVTTLAQLQVDTLIVSPGLDWGSCLLKSAPPRVTLRSDIDLFFDVVEQPVVGVTGTNGKSTVTSLVGHLLQSAGIDCRVGGNLGEAALDLIDDAADSYVLELSSFQLERTQQQRFAAATILNISEDHLDKHGSFEAYRQAKQRIFTNCALAVANRSDPATTPVRQPRHLVTFGLDAPVEATDYGICQVDGASWLCVGAEAFMPVTDLPLQGTHNVANALAACALASPWLQPAQCVAGLHSFTGLTHRFELVARHQGVQFIDDSKATNVGAAVAALDGFDPDASVVLLGGGDAKGADLMPMVTSMRGRVKQLLAVGQDGAALVAMAQEHGIKAQYCDSFEQAVERGCLACSAGDTLLLSPGCASIDMFPNFKVRGETFARLVRQFIETQAGGGVN